MIRIAIAIACLLYLSSGFLPEPSNGQLNSQAMGSFPVLVNGRIKPLDTVARNSLQIISGKQSFQGADSKLSAMQWLLEVLYDCSSADKRKVFRIDNPDLLALFGKSRDDGKFYSFAFLETFQETIKHQASMAGSIEARLRSSFQKQAIGLQQKVSLYSRLRFSLQIPGATNVLQTLERFMEIIDPGLTQSNLKAEGKEYNVELVDELRELSTAQFTQAHNAYFLPILPDKSGDDKEEWKKFGQAVMQCADSGELSSMIKSYASLGDAFRAGTVDTFGDLANTHLEHLQNHHPGTLSRTSKESLFNQLKPFSRCIVLYIAAFLSICTFWLLGRTTFRDAAFSILIWSIAVHAGALATRMWLENRPPVTNLYSSAVFVGFGAVVLGAILEKFYRNGIGTVAASLIGFLTLLIAHALSLNGDTLEMMRAVLDSNFWLATHVVVISLGYAATFLAGALAIAHIILSLISKKYIKEPGKNITGMVYAIICFATLFSFVGTILGGIWADQSWGRFWGWDPKENGALLIVLWNAVILHARWGGIIHQRGLMLAAVFGNIVTSWSWFGTNMLGVGLHSYGFTTAAFRWLLIFAVSQLIIMIIGGFCLKQPSHKVAGRSG